MGRPSKYNKNIHPDQARFWAAQGCIDEVISRKLGVSWTTFIEWKKKHKEFNKAYAEGKAEADNEVQGALYRRATGFSYEETKTTVTRNEDGNVVETKTITTPKRVLGSVAAQKFWNINRRPHEWQDLQRVETEAGPDLKEMLEGFLLKREQKSNKNNTEDNTEDEKTVDL